MLITDTGAGTFGSQVIPAAQAAVSAVNAAGGIGGRPLKLQTCDGHLDPNQLGACARKAVSDSSIVATVGNDTFLGGASIDPVPASAGMAAVATDAFTAADNTSPIVFTVQGGGIAVAGGTVVALQRAGSKSVAQGVLQSPAGATATAFFKSLLDKAGISLTSTTEIPPTAVDMTSYAAQMIRGNPDAVTIGVPEGLAVPLVKAVRAQGYKGKLVLSASVFNGPDLKSQVGSVAGDVLIAGAYSQSSPGYAKFTAEMSKYAPSAYVGFTDLNSWIGVHQFADVASKISGPITRASVLAAFRGLTDYSTNGLTPPLTYTTPNPVASFARLFNPTSNTLTYSDGVLSDVKPVFFVNFLTGAQVQPSP